MLDDFTEVEWLVRVVVALAAGGMVGFEREMKGKTAGLRTNMLVALGASVYTIAALHLTNTEPAGDWVRTDAVRIISGIAGGIGFLGAGAIIQSRGDVQGLTTAAAIWVSGAAGVASGLGLYAYAIAIAVGAVAVLWLVALFEHLLERRHPDRDESG